MTPRKGHDIMALPGLLRLLVLALPTFLGMASMSLPHVLYTIWLPLALTLLFGVVGFLRGLWREAVVSAAIVIGALIAQQWVTPDRWVGDIGEVFSGADPGWIQFTLGTVITLLTVLLVGYVLGGRLVGRPRGASLRAAGALLGLANGSALAGWLLRYAYEGLDRTQLSSPLYNDAFSQAFMIWAGWFPVALALLGALIGLLAPLRRAQIAIAQPSPQTDWSPAPPTTFSPGQSPSSAGSTRLELGSVAPTPYSPSSPLPSSQATVRVHDRSETTVLPVTYGSTQSAPTDQRPSGPLGSGPAVESRSPYGSIHEQPTELVPRVAEESGRSSWVADAAAAARRCARCGAALSPDAAFCTECGLRVSA